MDLNIIKDLIVGNGLNVALSLIGVGSIWMLWDNIGSFLISMLFKNEGIALKFIDMLDERYLDSIEIKLPKTHNKVQTRLIGFLRKAIAKIED